MMNKYKPRKYPRTVWVLSPAYMVKQVTVVKKANPWSEYEYGDVDEKGKCYRPEAMHTTKQSAIAYGRQLIIAREEYLEKQHALLDARRIKLDKAEEKA